MKKKCETIKTLRMIADDLEKGYGGFNFLVDTNFTKLIQDINFIDILKGYSSDNKNIVDCKLCEKLNIAIRIYNALSWRGFDNKESILSYDRNTEEILINEEELFKLIQLTSPKQQKRKIRLTPPLKK